MLIAWLLVGYAVGMLTGFIVDRLRTRKFIKEYDEFLLRLHEQEEELRRLREISGPVQWKEGLREKYLAEMPSEYRSQLERCATYSVPSQEELRETSLERKRNGR